MSWAGSEPWDLYLGATSGGVARCGQDAVWKDHATVAAGVAALFERVTVRRRRWLRPEVRIWLSGSLARPFVFEPPDGLKNAAEAHALAQARAGDATGLAGPCAVWLSQAAVGQAQLAVALDMAGRSALMSAAELAKVKVVSIRPWWAQALNQALARQPDLALLAAEDSEALTLLVCRGDVWVAADAYAPKPMQAELEPLVKRRLFAADLADVAACRVRLDGTALADSAQAWPAAALLPSFEQT